MDHLAALCTALLAKSSASQAGLDDRLSTLYATCNTTYGDVVFDQSDAHRRSDSDKRSTPSVLPRLRRLLVGRELAAQEHRVQLARAGRPLELPVVIAEVGPRRPEDDG